MDVSKCYEELIGYLLRKSESEIQMQPYIDGMTPDILVKRKHEPDIIIECMVKLIDPEHKKEFDENRHHSCGGEIKDLHKNLYSAVEKKITKYRTFAEGNPYVVAIYDEGCMSDISTAISLAFSAYAPYVRWDDNGNIREKGWSDQWSGLQKSAGLFKLYPHLSGFIYSRRERTHYFIPNPFAAMPVPNSLFPFAHLVISKGPNWLEQNDPSVNDDYMSKPDTYWYQIERFRDAINKRIDGLPPTG